MLELLELGELGELISFGCGFVGLICISFGKKIRGRGL